MKTSRLLWLDNREPRPDAAVVNPESAQFQLWLAQAQRDNGSLSDHDMSKMERAATVMAARSQVLFNPFTGQFRTRAVHQHYSSGRYLEVGNAQGALARIITG